MKKMYEREIEVAKNEVMTELDRQIAVLQREKEIAEISARIIADRHENGIDNRPLALKTVVDIVKSMQHLDDPSVYALLAKRKDINVAE